MKKCSSLVLLITLFSFALAQQRPAQQPKPAEQPRSWGKWYGVVFSDFSYIVQEPQTNTPAKGQAGKNSFSLTRVQLGYEYLFNRDFSARVVYDPTDSIGIQEANIMWMNVLPMHSLSFGMMHTTAEQTAEKVFSYRSLGPMLFNRVAYAPEYDAGLVWYGKFDPQGMMHYSLSVANGSGTFPDNDKIKKFALTFGLAPDKASIIELYVDYENRSLGRSVINTKLMYGITSKLFSLGVEGFYRMERKFAGTKDIVPAGGSLFSWFEMTRGLRGVVRVDGMDQDLNNSSATSTNPSYREIYVNAGIDYTPIPEVHFIPNVIYQKWLKKGSSPTIADEMIARLTAAVYFK